MNRKIISYLFSLLLVSVLVFQGANTRVLAAPLLPPGDAIAIDTGVPTTAQGYYGTSLTEIELTLANKFENLQQRDLSELWFFWHNHAEKEAYTELNLVIYEVDDSLDSFGTLVYSQAIDTTIFADDLVDTWIKIEFDNVFKAINNEYYVGLNLHCFDDVSVALSCFIVGKDNDTAGGENSYWHDVYGLSGLSGGFAKHADMGTTNNHMIRVVATERPLFEIEASAFGSVTSDVEYPSVGETVTLTAQSNDGYQFSEFLINDEPIVGNTFIMPDEDVIAGAYFKTIGYQITHGHGQSYVLGETDDISFTSDGLLSLLNDVKVDYVSLDAADYEVRDGSVILTLKNSFINGLAEGGHIVTMEFSNNSTAGALFIALAAEEELEDEVIIDDKEDDQIKSDEPTADDEEDDEIKNDEPIADDEVKNDEPIIDDEVKGDEDSSKESLIPEMGDNNNSSILGLLFITLGFLFLIKKEEATE